MGRNSLLFVKSLLIVFVLVLSSCKNGEIEPDGPAPGSIDLRLMHQSANDLAVGGTPASIVIGSQDFTTNNQQLTVNYSAENLAIKLNESLLTPGQSYAVDMSKSLTMMVSGLTLGEHRIKVTVSENGVSSSIAVSINVREKVYEMVLIDEESKERLCGKRMAYNFRIIDSENPNAINANYKVWARVTKGKGVVQMMTNEVLWNDTIPNYIPQMCIVPNEKWGGLYTGYEIGENHVEFTIEDKDNQRTTVTHIFHIDSSRFTIYNFQGQPIPPVIDTIELSKGSKGYTFNIKHFDSFENRYFIGVEWDSPYAGVVYALDEEITTGQWTKKGLSALYNPTTPPLISVSFVPKPVGGVTHHATILVKDLHKTIHRVPVSFHVRGSGYNTDVVYEKSYTQFETKILTANISNFANDYDAEFSYRYLAVPGYDFSGMLFYSSVGGDGLPVWQKMNETYKVKSYTISGEEGATRYAKIESHILFSTSGTKVFDLEITDRFGVKRLYRQQMEIKPNILSFNLDKTVYDAVIGQNPAVMKPTASVTLTQGTIKPTLTYRLVSGKGNFTADGQSLISGASRKYDKLSDIFHFEFDPLTSGRHEIEITVSLPDGRSVVRSAVINATYPALRLEVTGGSVAVVQGEKKGIGLSASQAGHTDNIRWQYRLIEGVGTLYDRLTSAVISPNVQQSMAQTPSDQPLLLDFVSLSYAGNVKIEFTATDKDGVETARIMTFSIIAANLTLDITGVPTTVGLYDTFDFTMKLDKPHYTGKIKVEYTILTTSSSYPGRGSLDFTSGVSMNVGNYNQTFTPTVPGRTQIIFNVTDEVGKTATKISTFEITPPALSFEMSVPALTAAQPNGGESSFTFTVSEDSHPEQFEFEFTFNGGIGSITADRHPIYLDGARIYDGGTYNISAGVHTFKEVNNEGKVQNDKYPDNYSSLQEVNLTLTVRDKYNQKVVKTSQCLPLYHK